MPKLKEPKKSLKFTACRLKSSELSDDRPVIAESLPILLDGVASWRVCPVYPPNIADGCISRFGCNPPAAEPGFLDEMREFVVSWCEMNLRPLPLDVNLETDHWISSRECYSLARRAELKRVWDKHNTGDLVNERHVRVKSFCKDEGYAESKHVRLINSREDYFKVYSGPLFEAISDELFANPWFIKNVPVEKRPDLMAETLERMGATYFMTDYTSMEAHFTPEVIDAIEGTMYRFMCRNNPRAMSIMEQILTVLEGSNVLHFKHVSLRLDGTRMSGEMNTSLGNGFVNLMLFLFACHKRQCGEVAGFVEGDDGIFRLQYPDRAPDEKFFTSLGWTIKIQTTPHLNQASFCGNIFDVVDRVVISDISKHLRNFGWCPKRYVGASRSVKLQLLKAKGYSLAHQFAGCPVLAKLGHKLVTLVGDMKIRQSIYNSMDAYSRDVHRSYSEKGLPVYREPSIRTRNLVSELYGIPISHQIDIENFIDTITLPDKWHDTIILKIPVLQPAGLHDFWDDYVSVEGRPWSAPCSKLRERRQVERLAALGPATRNFIKGYSG